MCGAGHQIVVDPERGRYRTPLHRCWFARSRGPDAQIDQIAIDENRSYVKLASEIEGPKKPVIDDNVSVTSFTPDLATCFANSI